MFNRSILAGNLTRDPELRHTAKGAPFTTFAVAANRTWTTESGERKQDASFIECTAWHRTAEVIAQYFRKGHPILVEGELRNSNWETESGEKRTRIYLHVDHFTFLRSKREGESAQAAPAPAIGRHGPDGQDDVPF